MFIDNHLGGTYYVAGGAQTYSNTLEKAIEKNGGTIMYNQKVEQITFKNSRACGIKLVDGTIIGANSPQGHFLGHTLQKI